MVRNAIRSTAAVLAVAVLLGGCGIRRKKYANPITKDTQQPDKVLFDKAINDIEHSRFEVARLLLEKGADVRTKGSQGFTALFAAAQNGHVNVVRLLLDQGARVDDPGPEGETPLMAAAEEGHLDVVARLLSMGADVNGRDPLGDTALTRAQRNGQEEAVKVLQARGAK